MRAALLPTPGDELMVRYWLRNFATWADEVDELRVVVNGQSDQGVIERLRGMVTAAHPGAVFDAVPVSLGHDGAMLRLLQSTTADLIVMCEDDAYVRRPGSVRAAFDRLESDTDLVGSPRHEDYADSYVPDWGTYVRGDLAELRKGLWPAFLFARPADLLATDCIFGDRAWPRGGTIPGWGPVTPAVCDYIGIAAEFVHLDTFFGTTFQLRAAGLRTELVHRVRVYDPRATTEWVEHDPPWFHVTNLSTLGMALDGTPLDQVPDLDEHGGLWTRRVAWWERTGHDLTPFIERTGMRRADIEAWTKRFDPWVTWAE